MAQAIKLGRITDTMEEGFLANVNIKVGDKIKSGDTIAEVETDKATMPLESDFNGTILHVAVKKGDTLKIGGLIAIIGKEGEDFAALLADSGSSNAAAPKTETKEQAAPGTQTTKQETTSSQPASTPQPVVTTSNGDDRIKASPLARMIAKEKGIDLGSVKGSGEEGRIVKRDLEGASANGNNGAATKVAAPAYSGKEGYSDTRVSQMRKTIARRLGESKNGAPHFYLTIDLNMDKAVKLRTDLNAALPTKVSFNDMVIKAVATALRQNPAVNCSWLGDVIRHYEHIHIGMAVAVEDGLLVPVIKFADGKGLQQINAEAKAFAEKASSKKLQPSDMEGNTFTISNLGMFGIEDFTAIINPPDACILAVGAIRQEPGVVNGEIKVVNKMKVTLSCDHRAVDGAQGAKFLQTFKNIIENPLLMLV